MKRPTARIGTVPHGLAARIAALPQRRQERIQDLGLAVALAAVNAVSLLPYRAQLHPLWLALVLVIAQAIPLTWRRARPVGIALAVGVARVAYDKVGFGFAPLPLGPAIAFYTIIDRREPVWRWVGCALVVIGITVSQSSPGHSEPYDAIFQALIFLTAWAAGVLSRTQRASLQAAESRADRAEAESDRRTAGAAALERSRIARELHDVVAHHVSLMAVQAEAAASLLPDRPAEARRSVEIIGDTARQALTELRRLLGVLRGPSERVQTSPSASLGDLAGVLDQMRDAGLPVDLAVVGTPYPLAPGIDLTAYRIVQEALTNTLRHAEAARATVTLSYEPGYITVCVADSGPRLERSPSIANGIASARPEPELAGSVSARHLISGPASGESARGGPAPGGSAPPSSSPARHGVAGSGLGLAGIAERVASCGGSLTVGPTSPHGFALTARLPSL